MAEFQFSKFYNGYPPFFTIQPSALTQEDQMKKWSALIQDYCRFYKIFQLSIVESQDTPLFNNAKLKKRLAPQDIKRVIDYMASLNGDSRAEWASSAKVSAWIWWRKPEEWGELIAAWVDETGQKGAVLTLYEIVDPDSDAVGQQEFRGMDMQVLQKSLETLTKKGKAQVFGTEDEQGVKFF